MNPGEVERRPSRGADDRRVPATQPLRRCYLGVSTDQPGAFSHVFAVLISMLLRRVPRTEVSS